jgi:hypothetical protein
MKALTKAAFNKKKDIFTCKLDSNFKKKLVKCYMVLYGAENWTHLKRNIWKVLKCGAGE